jgi:hypothetical protein
MVRRQFAEVTVNNAPQRSGGQSPKELEISIGK